MVGAERCFSLVPRSPRLFGRSVPASRAGQHNRPYGCKLRSEMMQIELSLVLGVEDVLGSFVGLSALACGLT